MEQCDQDLLGFLPYLLFGQSIPLSECFQIVGRRTGRELVELCHDATLHLVGGLIGESHSQDTAIGTGSGEEKCQILARQLMGLARTCRGPVDRQHSDEGLFDFTFGIARLQQQFQYLLPKVALQDNLALLGRSTYATFHF